MFSRPTTRQVSPCQVLNTSFQLSVGWVDKAISTSIHQLSTGFEESVFTFQVHLPWAIQVLCNAVGGGGGVEVYGSMLLRAGGGWVSNIQQKSVYITLE